MAVYTQLSAETLSELIAQYDVGGLVSAKGIAEGISNSNWLIETTRARYILTMYERRFELADLPFFLGLMDHLSAKGCPVPRTIHDRAGANFRMLDGKAVALIEFLPGVSVDNPTTAQARSVGEALAQNHAAVADFAQNRANDLGRDSWKRAVENLSDEALAQIDPSLSALLHEELDYLASKWDDRLPSGVVHCDLFPDNVLMLDAKVSGLIDFYFAATDLFAYDLAVTHAAWSFSADGESYRAPVGQALAEGYGAVRQLSDDEREAMPWLLRGACLRFIISRVEDWISTPPGALVARKDPMDFVRRLQFYRGNAASLFE